MVVWIFEFCRAPHIYLCTDLIQAVNHMKDKDYIK